MMRNILFAVFAVCLVLPGCAPRGSLTVLPEAARTGTVVEILVATSRGATDDATIAARARADSVRWASVAVSIPPERTLGTVTFPSTSRVDPKTDFLTVATRKFADETAFLRAVNARLAERPRGDREITLFVHGFNSNFAEGIYRHAQMAHDFRSPGISVSYAWPSAGSVRSYGFDRESALFARDGLEETLELLARSNAERIVVAGHSMGTIVVMEALRQMQIRGTGRALDKVQAVVLIAPDIDPDLFRADVLALAPRELPIYISVSGRDRALRASALLRGQAGGRLGSIQNTDVIADLPGVLVIDVSNVQGSGDPLNHFAVATSPAMIAFISGLDRFGTTMLRDQERPANVLEATVNAVTGVAEVVLPGQK
ncbi:alpha/beta hydrolase [Palleronia sp. KMU-117]|uniref:alpha/beta hydrolase n=1 Tax=Palleronia sp. KMU-117 TaxID=3434108 RepID=UPI003D75E591